MLVSPTTRDEIPCATEERFMCIAGRAMGCRRAGKREPESPEPREKNAQRRETLHLTPQISPPREPVSPANRRV